MRSWALGLMSNEEKRSILDQHRSLYDGYRTMQPKVASEQPLYVQDFANDKGGITVSNKNNVTTYKNVGINESVMEEKSMCSECGGMMQEGECSECGWKGDMAEEMQQVKDLKNVEDLNLNDKFDYVETDMKEDDSFDALAMQDLTGQEAPHDAENMAPDGMDDDSDNNRKMMKDEEMKETQQGNPYDNEQSAYNFVSDGPLQEYEPMESAFKDDEDDGEELYPTFSDKKFVGMSKRSEDMDDGEELYPTFSDKKFVGMSKRSEDMNDNWEDEDVYHEKDLAPDELDLDIEKFNPEDKSWEEIKAYTNMWDEIDEDIKESVIAQKNKIVEMFQRMKKF